MDISLSEITNLIPLAFKSGEKNEDQSQTIPAKDSINGTPAEPPRDYIEDIISLGSEQPDAQSSTLRGKMPHAAETEVLFPSAGEATSEEPTIPLPKDAYTPSKGNGSGTVPILEGMYDMSGKKFLNPGQKNSLPLPGLPNAPTQPNPGSIPLSELRDAHLNMLPSYSILTPENEPPMTLLNNEVPLSPEYAGLTDNLVQQEVSLPLANGELTGATARFQTGGVPNTTVPFPTGEVPNTTVSFTAEEATNAATLFTAYEVPNGFVPIPYDEAPNASIPLPADKLKSAAMPLSTREAAEHPELFTASVNQEASVPLTSGQAAPNSVINTQKAQADPLLTALMQDDSASGLSEALLEPSGMAREIITASKPFVETRLPNYSAAFANGVDEEAQPSEILLRNIKLNAGGIFLSPLQKDVAAAYAPVVIRERWQKDKRELPYSLYLFGNAGPEMQRYIDLEYDTPQPDSDVSKKPANCLRISEAIKMASIVHNLYYGQRAAFLEGIPWHGVYVEYALDHRIISEGDFEKYNEFVTRAEMTYIFSNAVSQTELLPRNNLPLPLDVPEDGKYSKNIGILLHAGILAERASGGKFNPDDYITPTEASVIMGRIVNPVLRK